MVVCIRRATGNQFTGRVRGKIERKGISDRRLIDKLRKTLRLSRLRPGQGRWPDSLSPE
jgi:hypothetical protein